MRYRRLIYSFRLAQVSYLTELRVVLDQTRFNGSGQRMRFHSGEIAHERPWCIDQQMVDCKLRQPFAMAQCLDCKKFCGKDSIQGCFKLVLGPIRTVFAARDMKVGSSLHHRSVQVLLFAMPMTQHRLILRDKLYWRNEIGLHLAMPVRTARSERHRWCYVGSCASRATY
jgi:hypothetical protein